MSVPGPRNYKAEDLRAGLSAQFEREIAEEDILTFARLSGDWNPLHVDPDYASRSNYEGRIVHGAFQVGLASAMLGMYLPGKLALLNSINSRFPVPLYFPCAIRVCGEITSWNPPTQSGQLKVLISDSQTSITTAEIVMGFSLHRGREDETAKECKAAASEISRASSGGSPWVLVAGASGGIGREIVSALASDYRILALVHRNPLDKAIRALPNVHELRTDLFQPGWERDIEEKLEGSSLYGIIHAAWPGLPKGGLLDSPMSVIENQMAFGLNLTIQLAQLIFRRADPRGGRYVSLGSIVGSFNPVISLGAYSLSKATMEHAVRLLAPELARKKITINALCPTFVLVGLNKQAGELQKKKEEAVIPMGRMCGVNDIVGMIRYLLSPEASFLSGQVVALSGGQL